MSKVLKSPLEMFYHWEQTAADQVFLRQSVNRQWREYRWAEVSRRVRCLANFIGQQGYEPGSRIAILASNCADWFVVDLAIMLSGHISVPLYPGQDLESARYILGHAEVKMVFVGNFDNAARADQMLGKEITRVAIHGCTAATQFNIEQVIAEHPPLQTSPVPRLEDIFTILYTSGTTGNPKGVMHAHGTPAEVVPRQVSLMPPGEGRARLFSFLPLSHAAERIVVEMRALYTNSEVSFSAGLETFAEELREVRPTLFFAVPRLWAKFKAGIDAKIPPLVQAGFGEAEKLKVRQMLGLDQATVILTGSAPTPSDLHQWYLDMGIWLREGYGMTENFVDGCFYISDDAPEPGSVGWPAEGVELKLIEDDEVCFRSPGLMKGYYREPAKTAEVLVDGWYRTGDSGRLDAQGRLTITGRLSEVFKTSKGKFIKPSRIEDKFAAFPELAQICVFGHGEDQPYLLANLSELGMAQSRDQLADTLIQGLAAINASLPPYERVAGILITPGEWTMGEGLLTPTLKIKRKALVEKFGKLAQQCRDGSRLVWV